MRFLILFSLFINIAFAERVEMRKVNERINQLKDLNSSHCAQFGVYKTKCEKDFDNKMLKKIRELNNAIVSDKDNKAMEDIGAVIAEENAVAKYRKLLDSAGISYNQNENSDSLKSKYDTYQAEQAEEICKTNRKNFIDQKCSGIVSYNGTETCEELEFALSAANWCEGSGSGSGQ